MADEPALRPGALALVTGAGSGIGAAVAEALAARDCRVICAARRIDRLRELARRLGSGCHPLELDVTDADGAAGVLDRLPAELREIDILVNNAGHDAGGRQRFDLGEAGEWASIIETNVIGLMRVSHAVVPGMVARRRGHVVNIGSIAGLRAIPGGSVYAASKFAVRGFSDGLRADYEGSGVRVTEIMPGTARTEFALARWHGDRAKADAFYGGYDTLLAAEDVARCVVFALEQPAHVVVSRLVVVPTSQS